VKSLADMVSPERTEEANMLRTICGNIGRGIACLTLCVMTVRADSIQLRDGRHLQGKYLGGTTTAVEFMTDKSIEYLPVSDVLVLVFDNPSIGTNIGYRSKAGNSAQSIPKRTPKRGKDRNSLGDCCSV
jgi:hypothetical protein